MLGLWHWYLGFSFLSDWIIIIFFFSQTSRPIGHFSLLLFFLIILFLFLFFYWFLIWIFYWVFKSPQFGFSFGKYFSILLHLFKFLGIYLIFPILLVFFVCNCVVCLCFRLMVLFVCWFFSHYVMLVGLGIERGGILCGFESCII